MPGVLRFPNVNHVTISGRLAWDIELKHSNTGVSIASFRIASSRYYKDDYGNYQEIVSWVDCCAFGKNAQICSESLKKGSPVLIEGNLRTRTYTNKNNQEVKVTEVIVDRVFPLERDENYVPQQGQYQNTGYNQRSNQPAEKQAETFTYPEAHMNTSDIKTEDDVPF